MNLGNNQKHACPCNRRRLGGCAVAQSPILLTAVTIEQLKIKGYVSLIRFYKNDKFHHRTSVYETLK
jgi:hypothetical protein